MAGDLGPFRTIWRDKQAELDHTLATGRFVPYEVAVLRKAIILSADDLVHNPQDVLNFLNPSLTRALRGRSPAEKWFNYWLDEADRRFDPKKRDERAFRAKLDEFLQFCGEIRAAADQPRRYPSKDVIYFVYNSEVTRALMYAQADALFASMWMHRYDSDFFEVSAQRAKVRLDALERPDLAMAVRIASNKPGAVDRIAPQEPEGEQRPWIVEAAETAISFIPLVGTAVSAYEAFSGKDLFGYSLSDTDRALMGAFAFLPFASHLVSEERALCSVTRLAAIYGGEEEAWSHALSIAERIESEEPAFARLRRVEASIAETGTTGSDAVEDLQRWLKDLDLAKAGKGAPTAMSPRSIAAFEALVGTNARWAELDANAIERIARYGRQSGVQGQLVEEVLMNRVVVWLRDPAGKAALGLTEFEGRLVFFPGYLIRDANGRQLTDGVLAIEVSKGEYVAALVFEAKSGEYSASGLAWKKYTDLTEEGRAELKAAVDDAYRATQEWARRSGVPQTPTWKRTTYKQIQDAALKSQVGGGQIGKSLGRLQASSDVRIGGESATLTLTSKSKFVAVVPSDVDLREARAAIGRAGITNFFTLGIGYTTKEVRSGADTIAAALGFVKKKK